jgi:hypothetical protein
MIKRWTMRLGSARLGGYVSRLVLIKAEQHGSDLKWRWVSDTLRAVLPPSNVFAPLNTRDQSVILVKFRSHKSSGWWYLHKCFCCTFTDFSNSDMTYVSDDPNDTYINDPAWWPFIIWTHAYSNFAGESNSDVKYWWHLTNLNCGFAVASSVVVVYDWGEWNNTSRGFTDIYLVSKY